MKQKITGMVALALVFTMLFSMTALAAPSVSTTNTNVNNQVMAEYAKTVTPAIAGTNGSIEAKAAGVLAYDAAVNAATSLVPTTNGQVAAVKAVFELNVQDVTSEELAAGVTVTLAVPGIVAGRSYVILHMLADGTWEVIPATVNADGSISGVFHSFSPVAVVEVAAAGAASPKTADVSAMPFVLGMIALCGMAVVSYRKANAF